MSETPLGSTLRDSERSDLVSRRRKRPPDSANAQRIALMGRTLQEFDFSQIPTQVLNVIASKIGSVISQRRKEKKAEEALIKEVRAIKKTQRKYDAFTGSAKERHAYNSSALLDIPHRSAHPFGSRVGYAAALMDQDWSSVYPCKGGERIFYVYMHCDTTKPLIALPNAIGGAAVWKPFYVGKGCGDRAYDLNRNQGHGKKIAELRLQGKRSADIVRIVYSGLTEQKAFEIEAKLIYFLGSIYDKTVREGLLLNLDLPKVPEFVGFMKTPGRFNEERKDRVHQQGVSFSEGD